MWGGHVGRHRHLRTSARPRRPRLAPCSLCALRTLGRGELGPREGRGLLRPAVMAGARLRAAAPAARARSTGVRASAAGSLGLAQREREHLRDEQVGRSDRGRLDEPLLVELVDARADPVRELRVLDRLDAGAGDVPVAGLGDLSQARLARVHVAHEEPDGHDQRGARGGRRARDEQAGRERGRRGAANVADHGAPLPLLGADDGQL